MELDELKHLWQETDQQKTSNKAIMEMIQNKSYGPVAALKKEFRKQIIVMAILPVFMLLTNVDDISKPLTSVLFWAYVMFCASVVVFAYRNYRIAEQMSSMDGMVKTTLEQHVSLLQQRIQTLFIGLRVALISLIILTEIVPYIQHYRMLDKWHSLSPFIRFGSYIALLSIQYFLSKKMLYRKFGSHLSYLKKVLQEMTV